MAQGRPSGVRLRVVRSIFLKEIKETLRDKKTLFLLVAIPLIFYPLLLVLVTEVALSQSEKIEERVGYVAIEGEAPPELLSLIEKEEKLELSQVDGDIDALQSGAAQTVVVLPEGFSRAVEGEETSEVTLRYNSVSPHSSSVYARVRAVLDAFSRASLSERLSRARLPETFPQPIKIQEKDVAPRERQLGSIVSQFLPMLVLVFMVAGAFYPAIDLTAGEKERKTIQTLLTSPVRPLEVVWGKYLTVFCVAVLSGAINLLSIAMILGRNVMVAGSSGGLDLGFQVAGADLLGLLWMVFLLGILFSALMMTIATLADTPKDAQSYLSPVYLLCLVPVMIAQIPGIEMTHTTALIPVLNVSLAMKEILVSGVVGETMFTVTASSVIVTILILMVAAKLYGREELLIGQSGPRGIFSSLRTRGEKAEVPSPGAAVALLSVLFVLFYYAGSALQAWHLVGGLLLTLYGLFLVPVVLAAKGMKLDLRRTFHLRKPSGLAMAGALLLGVSSFVWVSTAVELFHQHFMPVPETITEAMKSAFSLPESWPEKLGMILVMAVTPAICEEAVFRGWLMSSLRGRVSAAVAIGATAVVFGVFHLSIYRFLGTASLGILMGWMVWYTRSIWPAVLYHFLNNATSLLSADLLRMVGVDVEAEMTPWWLIVGSLLASGAGGALLLRSIQNQKKEGGSSPESPSTMPLPL